MRLLQHFVEAQAAALAGVIKIHGLDAGGITAAGTGGGSIDDMRQTTWAKPVVLRLEALVHELGAALSVPVAGIGLGGGRRGERADHLLAASFAARAGASLSGRGLGADRGLERLFTVKVQVAAPVDLAVEPVLLAVLRAACKVLVERVRATTLSPRGYCQLQVDVQVLRMAVGAYVKDTAALEALLEEVREMGWGGNGVCVLGLFLFVPPPAGAHRAYIYKHETPNRRSSARASGRRSRCRAPTSTWPSCRRW